MQPNSPLNQIFPEKLKALRLLNRQPEAVYIDNCTSLLARPKDKVEEQGSSVMIFRLGNEWLALDTAAFFEVVSKRTIHRLPHRSKDMILGVVNFQGQLTFCVNMHQYLGIHKTEIGNNQAAYERLVAIQNEQELWLFPVDEIFGAVRFEKHLLENIPVTVMKSKMNYLRGILRWNERNVGLLDGELLFYSLKRGLS